MSLMDHPVATVIAVSDMDTAKDFYEGKLGLSGGKDQPDGGRTYTCAGGTQIHVYPSPDNAGKSAATQAFWEVPDTERIVDELTAKGVTFEQFGEPFNTDEKGIARIDGLVTAWIRDADGNVLGVGTSP
jgi:catechol 2,3-dioxygenase-like lactoylglutathione lyase family enzyme